MASEELEKVIEKVYSTYGKYAGLFVFLTVAPSEHRQVSFSFNELSALIGAALPDSAYKHQAWWSNSRDHPAARAWMDAKWQVQDVFRSSQVVVFKRAGSDPADEIPKYIEVVLGGKKPRKRPHCFQLADWIEFCRRVGWHFEGVTLYEKGGLSLDGLSEAQKVEVEEDYGVCKRALNKAKTENPYYKVLSRQTESDSQTAANEGGTSTTSSTTVKAPGLLFGRRRAGSKRDELMDLVAEGIVTPGTKLKHVSRGASDRYRGTVTESGGVLAEIDGKKEEFHSLSAAAVALTGSSVNGWIWWTAVLDNGQEVLMNELRRQHQNAPRSTVPIARRPDIRPSHRRRVTARSGQLSALIAAGLLPSGTRLKHVSVRTGRTYTGTVTRSGGVLVELNGRSEEFPTLSAAAVTLTGTSVNGWIWWTAMLKDGREVLMDELRKKHVRETAR